MSSMHQSSSYNSSAISSQFDNCDDANTYKIKNYAKDKLKSRVFLGRYVERRLADKEIGYRDIVLVSPAEVELKADLLEIQRSLRSITSNIRWIGITEADTLGYGSSGLCIWTEIDNQPFGPFWFQIKSLKFRHDEVIIIVKCLRHISDAFLELEPILVGAVKTKDTPNKNIETSVESLNVTYTDFVAKLKSFVSISNVKEFVTFLFAFVIAIFTGTSTFVNFVGNFILALIREMSILIKNSTPMFLGLLDFFSKIVGGFYILLAMLFKQNVPIPTQTRTIPYYDRSGRSSQYQKQQYGEDDGQFD